MSLKLVKQQIQTLPNYVYNNSAEFEEIVFICGLHRSGTTLLENLIVECFDVSFLRMNVTENEGQHAQNVYSPGRKYGGPGKFAFDKNEQIELHKLCEYEKMRKQILSSWGRFSVGKSRKLIEKSPPNLTKIWWLREVFKGCKFIIITRNPLAVALATQKWSKTSIEELLEHWHLAYSKALIDFESSDSIHVKYEELCDKPKFILETIGEFCKLKKRETTMEKNRFDNVKNSNAKYLDNYRDEPRKIGVWQKYGYTL